MPNRYTVAEGREFSYPADLVSYQTVKSAGGVSKLNEDQRRLVSYKSVKEGQDCSDMPKEALELYVSRGWVIDESVVIDEPVVEPVVELEPISDEEDEA